MNTVLPSCEGTSFKDMLQASIQRCCSQIKRNLPTMTYAFQSIHSTDQFYHPIANDQWTNGFWTGQLWLAYEFTHDPLFRYAAGIQVQSFKERIEKRINTDHHDLGFLYSLSCVAAWKLVKDEDGRAAALQAAELLLGRFHEAGRFIQAWGAMGEKEECRLIIDCLLNLPLLYWASEETGDPRYRLAASAHIETAMKVVVRPDFSTIHTYFFDPKTGVPLYGETHQGNRDNSAWARGQAWGVYGSILSYGYTADPHYLELFDHITDFYVKHLPADKIPYWDFDFTDGSDEPRDSSSAAIVICGLLEACRYVDTTKAAHYRKLAQTMAKSLMQSYEVKDPRQSNGLLMHSVYNRKTPTNTLKKDRGVDECCSWGDYYYMEALMRLSREDWNRYW